MSITNCEKVEQLQERLEQEQAFWEAMQDRCKWIILEFDPEGFDFPYADYGFDEEE